VTHAPTRSAPAPEPAPPTRPGLIRSVLAFLRNVWRQLTSMRTALILLFLLAVASLPGALLPQWSLNTSKTAQYIADHPTIGPWLDRLGFFEVFGSPWYAAIYLLLFTSLVGCLIPRLWEFLGQLRAQPVATPRNLGRLPHHDRREVAGSVDEVADRITAGLRGWRLARRVAERPGGAAPAVTLSAEKGFVRELGNLIFHFSLLGLLVAIAVGKMVGYEGSIIVNVGSQFCSTSPASYDNFRAGLLVDGTQLSPFCLDVRSFDAEYTPAGQATSFVAEVGSQAGSQAGTDAWDPAALQVNDPLRLDGERVYLIGHGYTPHFQVSFPDGTVRDYAQPFAPTPNDR
jgi:cytochrome c biogenesis protein